MGEIRESRNNGNGKFFMGLNTPDKKNWGKIRNGKIWLAVLWLLRFVITKSPNEPPSMQTKNTAGNNRIICAIDIGTPIIRPKTIIAIPCVNATKVSPKILPKIIVYRDIGDTNIS